MSLFNFSFHEMILFFLIFIRYSVAIAFLPVFGDQVLFFNIKIFISFLFSLCTFEVLFSSKMIHLFEFIDYSNSLILIVKPILLEVFFALIFGFFSRFAFHCIDIGSNLIGTFIGFSTASYFDVHQESQTQIVSKIQYAIAMLIFININGHHEMLTALMKTYEVVGVGQLNLVLPAIDKILKIFSELFRLGFQLASPFALSVFLVNIIFCLLSKSIPQLNLFAFSLGTIALVGIFLINIGMADFEKYVVYVFEQSSIWLNTVVLLVSGHA